MPAEYSFHLLTERQLAAKDTLVHPSIQPYIPFFNPGHRNVRDSHKVFKYLVDDEAIDLIFHRHFVQVRPKDEDFTLNIDPLLNLEAGFDRADTAAGRLYTNTRGIAASGTIGKKFYFETMIAENQALLPGFLADAAETSSIIPGQGRWKRFKAAGYDYAFATGLASAQVHKNVNIQFGHGKQKIGHGYRSLLLSDNAFNYPFVRVTQQWLKGRIRYSNIYSVMMNLSAASVQRNPFTERLFQKKPASFQLLEVQVSRAVNISVFQGVIWQPGDHRNRLPLGWSFVNPLIFSHLAMRGLDHPEENALAGFNLLYKITDRISIYGQLMADHGNDGYGYQAGAKAFDLFRIGGLSLQGEFNYTGSNAYSSTAGSHYTHYNDGLAYSPENGTETNIMADFRKKRFFVNLRYHIQDFADTGSGRRNIMNFKVGYMINPRCNLNISAGYLGRRNFDTFSGVSPHTDYLYIALRTSLYNVYYDF